jgi:hypothetical protein
MLCALIDRIIEFVFFVVFIFFFLGFRIIVMIIVITMTQPQPLLVCDFRYHRSSPAAPSLFTAFLKVLCSENM